MQTRAVDPFENHISRWSFSQALSADCIQLQQIVAISQDAANEFFCCFVVHFEKYVYFALGRCDTTCLFMCKWTFLF